MALRARDKPTRYRGTSSGAELAGLNPATAALSGPVVVFERVSRQMMEATGFEPTTPPAPPASPRPIPERWCLGSSSRSAESALV